MLRVLYDPDGFFKDYRDGWTLPIAIVVVCAVVNAILGYIRIPSIMEDILKAYHLTPSQVEMLKAFLEVQVVVSTTVGVFLGWVILAGVLHLLSAVFGGEGEFSRTLKNTAFSLLPSIVLSPITFAFITPKPTPESLILSLASYVWQSYILVFALKYARNIETKKAVVCVAIPIVILYSLSLLGFFMLAMRNL
ncbi:Yip1 family protein [Archaeoglobus sp.]